MEDKKILVFYVGVGDLPDDMVGNYVARVQKAFFTEEFASRIECEMILIPTREVNSRIECINPKYITEEALVAQHETAMKEYLTSINNFIKDNKSDA